MKRYERVKDDEPAAAVLRNLIELYHLDLQKTDARIELVWITDAKNPTPLRHRGRPAKAVARIIPIKDRFLGRGDAEIVVDREAFEALENEQQQRALLDHELQHFKVQKDELGATQWDQADRPKLKLRLHDVEFGWFRDQAARWGQDSMEILQAENLMERDGQLFFPQFTQLSMELQEA